MKCRISAQPVDVGVKDSQHSQSQKDSAVPNSQREHQ